MTCGEVRQSLDLYLDDELDVSRSLELEQHLESCSECAAALQEARQLSHAVRDSGVYGAMPKGLTTRVRDAVMKEARVSETPALTEIPTFTPAFRRRAWMAATAAIVLGAFAAFWVSHVTQSSQPTAFIQEVLDNHVRSLMASHLVDVPSSDQHTVKPWFDGKVDFSPPVVDLGDNGFELVGGRLDYIDGRPVATVVYRRRQHVINVFMWPDSESSSLNAHSYNGYHLLNWDSGGLQYWMVSDLNAQELREFEELLDQKIRALPK